MASNTADIGTGVTLTLGTSTWTIKIRDLNWSGVSRGFSETTDTSVTAAGAGTFGNKTFVFHTSVDAGEISVEFLHNPDFFPPIGAAAETITVTWLGPDGTAGATWVGTGACTAFDAGSPFEDTMLGTATFKFTGAVTVTVDA